MLEEPFSIRTSSQRLFVHKFLGPGCFMLISFTLINLEISIDNDFLKAFTDRSAELCNPAAFYILYYTEQLRRFAENLLPGLLLRAN